MTKIDKWKCDGCQKEGNAKDFTIRLVNTFEDRKNPSLTTILTDDVSVKAIVPTNNSLDFCTITCFELYLTNLKLAQLPEEPKL